MTERYERLFTYGKQRPVNYHDKETWTDEVKALYQCLLAENHRALAPLLKWDIEFLTDPKAIVTLILLKYAPELPDKECRDQLRKIANVIAQRPRRRLRKLPHGDQLKAELESLINLIKDKKLLEVKENRLAIQERLEEALYNPMLDESKVGSGRLVSDLSEKELLGGGENPPFILDRQYVATRRRASGARKVKIASLAATLRRVVGGDSARVRKPRSWALQAMADHYKVEPKQIEKSITREIRAGRRRR